MYSLVRILGNNNIFSAQLICMHSCNVKNGNFFTESEVIVSYKPVIIHCFAPFSRYLNSFLYSLIRSYQSQRFHTYKLPMSDRSEQRKL